MHPHVISSNNDPDHIPTYAELRLKNAHLSASSFELHESPACKYKWYLLHYPLKKYIYLTFPNGIIYRSKLEKCQENQVQN